MPFGGGGVAVGAAALRFNGDDGHFAHGLGFRAGTCWKPVNQGGTTTGCAR